MSAGGVAAEALVEAAGAAFVVIPGMSFMLSLVEAGGAAFVLIPGMSFIPSMPFIPFIPAFVAGVELGAFCSSRLACGAFSIREGIK